MPIPSGSVVKVRGTGAEWLFEFTGFDLDDCFDSLRITVNERQEQVVYDFGPCVVWALRKLAAFFENEARDDAVGGGFRNPDPCFYELRRRGAEYRLSVRFEGSGLQKEYALALPEILVDKHFLKAYDYGTA